MIITIQNCGDFDVRTTTALLESPQPDCDIKALLTDFYQQSGMSKDLIADFHTGIKLEPKITKNGISNVKNGNLYADLLIEFMIKKYGFKKIKAHEIIISD